MAKGGDQSLEPGGFASVMVPIMKVLGLGIAARGGALGPMLVGGGELVDEGYRTRQQKAVLNQLAQLQAPIMRRETTSGVPGTPSTPSTMAPTPPTALPESAVPPAAETVISGRMGTPDTPGMSREWLGERTRAEVLKDIAAMPEGLQRALVLQEYMKLKAPDDVARPQAVTEELQRARAREEETRKGGVFGTALGPTATPQQRGAAAAAGLVTPEPLPEKHFVQRSDGTVQEVDRRTGQPIGPPLPQRTEEQTTERTHIKDVLLPQYEKEFEAAVQAKTYTPSEAQVGRKLLARAKETLNPEPFLKFLENVVKQRHSRAMLRGTTADVPRKPITSTEALTRHQAGVEALAKELERALPAWKTASGPEKAKALQDAYRARHGVEIAVSPIDASGSSFALSGAWEPAGTRRTGRTYEPPPGEEESTEPE